MTRRKIADLGLVTACVFPGAFVPYWFGPWGFVAIMAIGAVALLDLFGIVRAG